MYNTVNIVLFTQLLDGWQVYCLMGLSTYPIQLLPEVWLPDTELILLLSPTLPSLPASSHLPVPFT